MCMFPPGIGDAQVLCGSHAEKHHDSTQLQHWAPAALLEFGKSTGVLLEILRFRTDEGEQKATYITLGIDCRLNGIHNKRRQK